MEILYGRLMRALQRYGTQSESVDVDSRQCLLLINTGFFSLLTLAKSELRVKDIVLHPRNMSAIFNLSIFQSLSLYGTLTKC